MREYPFRRYVSCHRRAYVVGLTALAVTDFIAVLLPLCIKIAIDALAPGAGERGFRSIVWAGLAYLALMTLQALGRYLWRVYLIGTSHEIARSLRLGLYQHLQRLPLSYYQTVRTGDLMSRATNDIESIRMAVGPGILVTIDAIVIFAFLVPAMIWLSPKLALLAFAFYPLVPWLTARLGRRIDELFEVMQVRMSRMSSHVQESFSAIRLIKSLVLESRVHHRFRTLSDRYREAGMSLARYEAGFSPALGLLTNLGTFLILLLGGLDVMEGALTVGTFVAFQRYVIQLSWPMEAIGWAVTMNREGVAAQRRLDEVMRVPPVRETLLPAVSADSSAPLLRIRRLRHRFGTDGKREFSLDIRELGIEPGQKIGIVGGVGSGKSTFFSLLLRLYEPEEGSAYFEGRDILSIPTRELRQRIGSVEQQIFLFSETIADNLRLGAARAPTDEDMIDSLRVAQLAGELAIAQKGHVADKLAERGVNLSGGQKQRLALARALVRGPDLLLLDDAFSAVDVAVEQRIIEGLFDHYPRLSLCFASHRLSIMPRMDELWLFHQGRVVARGTHRKLLESEPRYQELWEQSLRDLEETEGEVTLADATAAESTGEKLL